jgi:hypothetical protein
VHFDEVDPVTTYYTSFSCQIPETNQCIKRLFFQLFLNFKIAYDSSTAQHSY